MREADAAISEEMASRSKSEITESQQPVADRGNASPSITQQDQNSPWIRYSIEWRDTRDVFIDRREMSKNDVDAHTHDLYKHRSNRPAFERVAILRTKHDSAESKGKEVEDPIPPTGAVPSYYIRIYSVAIINALRSVVSYYPQQDLSGDIVEIPWPYPVLVHHYDELEQFRKACSEKAPIDRCVRETNVDSHLRLLLNFLDEEIMETVNAEKERNKRGYSTFNLMWIAFKPGTTMISDTTEDPEWKATVVHSLQGGTYVNPRQPWSLIRWSMKYDGKYLSRVQRKLTWHKFDGEKAMKEQGFVLLGSEDDLETTVTQNETVKQVLEYGKTYCDLITKQCRYHSGATVKFPYNQIEGHVMVDLKALYTVYKSPEHLDNSDIRDFNSDCSCPTCHSSRGKATSSPRFDRYNKHTENTLSTLTDHEKLLCPNKIFVFVFKTRTWEKVHVKNLSSPRFTRNMMKNLVMDNGRRNTLKSLAESFARRNLGGKEISQKPWTADFIDEKGNGMIVLLHGSPGVGKTFTAECIANFLERPLMILTTSDIGTDPQQVESNLMTNFKRAKSWNAVLLIDEADVFLANRTIEDLKRSSLVASFLRALEFYDGMLFLTTNRVGAFDDAILSRVHVQLYYPDLNSGQRYEVWQTFINKLEKERPSIQIKYAVKEYLRSSEMVDFEMNGREIRNAFQTTVALAEHRTEPGEDGKILLTEDHLREVIELYRSFKGYFVKLHGPEAQRALIRGERVADV